VNPTLIAAINLLPILLVSFSLPFLGHTRPGILFGVTVPIGFAGTPIARASLQRYRRASLLLALTFLAACILTLALHPHRPLILLSRIGLPLELLGIWLLMRREARTIRPHAITAPLQRSTNLLTASQTNNGPLVATLASVLPLAATGLYLRQHWQSIPARWPQHWNSAGIANGWGTRTPRGVYGPLFAAIPLTLTFLLLVAFMTYSSGPAPAERRKYLAPVAALAWLMSLLLCTIALLPLLHLDESGIILVMMVHVPLTIAVIVWALWRSGMSQPPTAAEMLQPYDGTPDSHWHAGIFYYNPADATVLVPKRFGWGWTLNFARPQSWLYLGGTLLLALAASAITLFFK
jgi:uncharacterized membrane protein